jgi:endonuclease-3
LTIDHQIGFIRECDRLLNSHFGEPVVKSKYSALDTLILTVLSQSTSDHNRDIAFAELKRRFPKWDLVVNAPSEAIAEAIHSGGLSKQKSLRIQDILRWVKVKSCDYNLDWLRELPLEESLAELTALKGVGIKTAAVVMAFAFKANIFPVDVHIHRICKRWKLVPNNASAERTHYLMQPLIPPGRALPLHLNMLKLGRKQCRPSKPDCEHCPVNLICPYIER